MAQKSKPRRCNAGASGGDTMTVNHRRITRGKSVCIEPCEACGKDVVNGGGYAFEQCGCPEGKAMEKAMMDEWTLPARVRIAQEDDAREAQRDRVAAFHAGWDAARADMPTGTPPDAAMDAVTTLADFTREVSLLGVEPLPAVLERSDGATLFYEARVNTLYGEPAGGKTWIAMMAAIQQIRRNGVVLWWDAEDRPQTFARRLQLLRATDLIGHPNLIWASGDLNKSPLAAAEAVAFLKTGERPGLVVVDSATSFGAPTDNRPVTDWLRDYIRIWAREGLTVLFLDHVPKQRKDRPKGGIGSVEKQIILDGAELYVHGIPWNGQEGGAVSLMVHKDRPGDLPAREGSDAATVYVEWSDDKLTLDWTIGLPHTQPEGEDVQDALLEALEGVGAEGVKGSRAMRELLKGKRAKDIDEASKELLQAGMIEREKVGRSYIYRVAQ